MRTPFEVPSYVSYTPKEATENIYRDKLVPDSKDSWIGCATGRQQGGSRIRWSTQNPAVFHRLIPIFMVHPMR